MADYIFTSESVTEGHPDKIADQISDAVLDAVFTEDPFGRVACETFVTTGLCLVGGEITTTTYVDIPTIARNTIEQIGYTNAKYGFDYETCAVLTTIDQQSADIAMGVDRAVDGTRVGFSNIFYFVILYNDCSILEYPVLFPIEGNDVSAIDCGYQRHNLNLHWMLDNKKWFSFVLTIFTRMSY